MRKVNLGIAGLGGMGKTHLDNILHLDSARILAVSDLSKKSCSYARQMGVERIYSDFEKLLSDKDIDGIVLSLPTYLHKEFAERIAEAGKHIFLEKPLARNENEAKDIVRATEKYGIKAMVGYPFRFSTTLLNLKKTMKSGVLGDIQCANATNISSGPLYARAEGGKPQPVPTWYFDKELTGGGALIDLGVHWINPLRWYFGEVTDVKAYLGHRFNLEVEDHAICMIKFRCGTISIVNVGWFSSERDLKLELFGTNRHFLTKHVYEFGPRGISAIALQNLGKDLRMWSPLFREIEYFVRCIQQDLQPQPSVKDAIKDMEVISLAYKNKISLD